MYQMITDPQWVVSLIFVLVVALTFSVIKILHFSYDNARLTEDIDKQIYRRVRAENLQETYRVLLEYEQRRRERIQWLSRPYL